MSRDYRCGKFSAAEKRRRFGENILSRRTQRYEKRKREREREREREGERNAERESGGTGGGMSIGARAARSSFAERARRRGREENFPEFSYALNTSNA